MVKRRFFMFLKKELFYIPFSKNKIFSIEYNDIKDLELGVFSLCDLLKKDIFLILVFISDPLNEQLKEKSEKVFRYENFNCYLMKNINIIKQFDFENIRFLNIYGIDNHFVSEDFIEMRKCSSFNLGFDNYLDYTKIIINFSKYDDCVISKLPLR